MLEVLWGKPSQKNGEFSDIVQKVGGGLSCHHLNIGEKLVIQAFMRVKIDSNLLHYEPKKLT